MDYHRSPWPWPDDSNCKRTVTMSTTETEIELRFATSYMQLRKGVAHAGLEIFNILFLEIDFDCLTLNEMTISNFQFPMC